MLLLFSCLVMSDFCNPGDYSPHQSFFVHGITQARILEWVAISYSRGSSQPRAWTRISCTGRWILHHRATAKPIKKKKRLYSFHLFDKYLWISYTFLGRVIFKYFYSFPDGSDGKESARNAGDPGLIPGLERSPGEGNGNPLQYSCLENPMDKGAWQATVHGVTKSQTRLSD